MLRFLCLWLLVLTISTSLNAQRGNLDSLLQVLSTHPEDTNKVELYYSIGDRYLNVALDSAPPFGEHGLALAQQLHYYSGQVRCYNLLGTYCERKTRYDCALEHYQKALDILTEHPSPEGYAIVLNNIAIIYMRQGDYEKALDGYFKALAYEETLDNQRGIAQSYNNIGVLYYYQQNIDKTVEYFEKSIEIEEALNQPDILKKGYNNLGALYDYQKKYNKALALYRKSYALSKSLNDEQEMAVNLHNIASAYLGLGKLDTAEVYLRQSIQIRENLDNERGAAYSYYNFALLLKDRERYDEALDYFNRCLTIATTHQLREMEVQTYKGLAELEESQNQYQAANGYWQQYITARDSLFTTETTEALAELESKYQVAQKEKALLEKQLEIDQQKLELEQKNNQLLLLGGTALVFLLLGLFGVYYLRQRNRQLEREQQLQAAQATIATQEQLQQQRYHISRDLHDNIGAQLTFIISSVENLPYRFELAPALTNRLQGVATFTRQTIQELRDTIWAMNQGSIGLSDLSERIHQFVHRAQGAAPDLVFEVHIDEQLQQGAAWPAAKGMQLYRLLQEAINNALKHAQAQHLKLRLEQQGTNLYLSVQDDGKGFDPQQRLLWNNGLHHLHQRAQELGGTCTIDSAPGKGTTISAVLPLSSLAKAALQATM